MRQDNILFIDRDGTLIAEPDDFQVDSIAKIKFMPGVIAALQQCLTAGYRLVIVSNQDGLGTTSFPQGDFEQPHQFMLDVFRSQGIEFDDCLLCPHFAADHCDCRKPKLGLLEKYLVEQRYNPQHSFVIGDRDTDIELAQRLGLPGLQITSEKFPDWNAIVNHILYRDREACVERVTKETSVDVTVNLDRQGANINTGIAFFDHMLEQIAQHAGIYCNISVRGDIDIDDHHTVEDTAITLGDALRQALGNKYGIGRYGFVLPMDEANAQASIDLSGRAYFVSQANFKRPVIGEFSTEMVPHFFQSLSQSLQASIHVDVQGENTHHCIEAMFKAFGRCLRQAIQRVDSQCPSTKGCL